MFRVPEGFFVSAAATANLKDTNAWVRLQVALVRHAGLGRNLLGNDPRDLPLADIDYIILIAIAAADGKSIPHLNQEQLTKLLQEKSSSTVSDSINKKLRRKGFCRELNKSERRDLGLPSDRRSNYYAVTTKGVEALREYETVRLGLPPAVIEALNMTDDYSRATQTLRESIFKVMIDEFSEAAR